MYTISMPGRFSNYHPDNNLESYFLNYSKKDMDKYYRAHIINTWEYNFYTDIMSYYDGFTERQIACIEKIEAKCAKREYILGYRD